MNLVEKYLSADVLSADLGHDLKLKDATIKFSGNEISMLSGLIGLVLAKKDILNIWSTDKGIQNQVRELWFKINKNIKQK